MGLKNISSPPLTVRWLQELRDKCRELSGEAMPVHREVPADPIAWLLSSFPEYFQVSGKPVPLAAHHEEFWRWIWGLTPGQGAPAFVQILARGGGKSTETELGCVALGHFGLRRYGLYVSGTQDQADDHVENVGTLFTTLGVERALSKYGYSKGWRASRLRTQDGFTLDAIGLDKAARGKKLDDMRPDFIILDDIDEEHDSEGVTAKKIKTLTRKILPMGTATTAVLGVQNLPCPDGIFAQLVDGRADFLLDRVVSGPYPALQDFTYELEPQEDGPTQVTITGGVPTWAGQDIAACQSLIARIGLAAFEVECLHMSERRRGAIFRREWFPIVDDYPQDAEHLRFWDVASTEQSKASPDPDWTAGARLAYKRGQCWIVDIRRFRKGPGETDKLMRQTAMLDGSRVKQRWEEEGGSSGKKASASYHREVFAGLDARGIRSTSAKDVSWRPLASAAEVGNVFLVRGEWNATFLDELERVPQGHDDQADAAGKGFVELAHRDRSALLSAGPVAVAIG